MLKTLSRILPVLLFCAGLAISCELLEGTAPGDDSRTSSSSCKLEIKKPAVTSYSGNVFVVVTAKGDWSIELSYPPDGPSGWATMDPASGSGRKGDVRIRYDENTGAVSRYVTLHLTVGSEHASATLEQLPEGLSEQSAGGFKSDTAPVGWLELPETKKGDHRTFYAHDMEGGGYFNKKISGTRNWSFYWDTEEFMSIWVAYPLNKNLIGSGSRTNQWGLDPLIPSSLQPNIVGGSYGGGWTRGHQIPSADRLNAAANVSTFYSTNLTPQDYNFNGVDRNGYGGIWARLEDKVRSYSSLSDTLYVVTGCVLEGSTRKTGGSAGIALKVPAAYFKALLYLSPNRRQYHSGYMAAGFYLPHDTGIADNNPLDYIMSIDELETKTGIDFFVNLPDAVGKSVAAAIEAEKPGTWWSR